MDEDCLSNFSFEFLVSEILFQREDCQVQISEVVCVDNVYSETALRNFQAKSYEDEHNCKQILPITFSIQKNCFIEFQGDAEEHQIVLHPTDDKHNIYNLTSLENSMPENSKRGR